MKAQATSSKGLRKAGMYLALGLALAVGMGAVGCSAHRPAPEPVVVTQTVVAPSSPYRQLGRDVREIGQQGRQAGQEIGRVGVELGKDVGAAAKEFWAGVRGK